MTILSERIFEPYDGPRTGDLARLAVIPRYAYAELFRSKMALVVFASGFVIPAAWALMIYLHHNADALMSLNIRIDELMAIDAAFFIRLLFLQSGVGFFLALIAGPPLIARDLQNNALPLYLARPLTRAEYVGAKLAVLVGPLSAVTWIPGLLLFGFQAALEPGWAAENWRILPAFFVGSWVWIVPVALFTLAVSAVARRRTVARAGMLGLVFVSRGVAEAVNGMLNTKWGYLLSPTQLYDAMWTSLFGPDAEGGFFGSYAQLPSANVAWITAAILTAAFVLVLSRRLRPWEDR